MRAARRRVVVLGAPAVAAAVARREDVDVLTREADLPGAAVVVLAAARPVPAALAVSAPAAVVVVAGTAREVDACLDATLLPRARVLGVGGAPASARWRAAIARAARVSPRDVTALVLDDGRSVASVAGVPARAVLGEALPPVPDEGVADEHEVALAVAEVVAAVLDDTRRVLPLALRLHGEQGRGGEAAVVPVVVGAAGAEAVLDLGATP